MSRKKAVRVKKKKIKNQMENAAEETVTVETEETAVQEAVGQSPSAEEQKTAKTAEPEKEIKEVTAQRNYELTRQPGGAVRRCNIEW